MRLKSTCKILGLIAAVVASSAALPAWADDSVVYEVDPGVGSGALASGTFTFDQTADTITSWDISVIDGLTTTVFENGAGESSSYGFRATAWDAHFSAGSKTYLDFYFASPGLGSIVSGPATVALLSKSTEQVGGVSAQIDNPSVSVVPEPGEFVLLLAGLGYLGLMMRSSREGLGALVPPVS